MGIYGQRTFTLSQINGPLQYSTWSYITAYFLALPHGQRGGAATDSRSTESDAAAQQQGSEKQGSRTSEGVEIRLTLIGIIHYSHAELKLFQQSHA